MNKALKIFLQTSTPIVVLSGIATMGVFLQPRKDANIATDFSKKVKKPLLKEINYLALGDFLSTGFDWNNNLDGRGNMVDGSISGISFPAFFANFAQSIQPDSVKSFKNLALNDSSTRDWIYLLDPKNNYISKENLSNFKSQVYNKSNFTETIRSVFGTFDGEFPKLIDEIKKANLISLSVGFKDFLDNFNSKFFDSLNSINFEENKKQANFKAKVNSVFAKITKNLRKLIVDIKKINPKAYINLIGYHPDQPKIRKFLDDLAKNYLLDLNDQTLSIERLNKEIEKVAESTDVNFVNPFAHKKWQENRDLFFDAQMNFRPQIKGNKQIAQNLILSLTLEPNTSESSKKTEQNQIIKTDFSVDPSEFQQIYLGSNSQILEKLTLNGSLANFINANSNFEEKSIRQLHTKPEDEKNSSYSGSVLEKITGFLGSQENQFVRIIKQLIETFGDKNNPNFTAFNNIVETIFKSKFFSNVIQFAQEYIVNSLDPSENKEKVGVNNQEKNPKNSEKPADLLTFLKEKALNEKAIVELLREITSSPYVQKHQSEAINLFYSLLFRQSTISELIVGSFSDNSNYQNIVSQVLSFQSVEKFVTFIITELIQNNSDYSTVESFRDFLRLFLQNSNNYHKSITFIKNFVIEALKKPVFLNSVFELVSETLGFKIEKEDQKSLITLLVSVSDILTKTKTFKNLVDLVASEIVLNLKVQTAKKDGDWSFFGKILTNLSTKVQKFFKEKHNIYNLFQDVLAFDPSVKQLESVKSLVNKFLPFIAKIQLNTFVDEKDPNYSDLNLIFNSFIQFASKDNFNWFNKIISGFLDDFFIINNYKYRNSLDFNGIIFNFINNNSELLNHALTEFIEHKKSDSKVLDAIISIFSKVVKLNTDSLQNNVSNSGSDKKKKILELSNGFFAKIKELTNDYNQKIDEINNKIQKAENSSDSAALLKKRNELRSFLSLKKLFNIKSE
ncbi:SGNH/GDSL hydrolase family protein [Mesomycoplasma dispar]|uniref:SGNH/GDSL hydrolase family protein n=1 Tax=Mesomycoplasma dispar TaxID=86660 RepID=A0ABM6PQE8_9BACT|nr:SGNH/GDSL hydrolase family protein [Mesomycoplasma dispar]ATP59412.1 SGNH/GDSL hydrolase family protein [Mesomycoplasma dispar]